MSWFARKRGPPDAKAVLDRAIILKVQVVTCLASPSPDALAQAMEHWSEEDRTGFVESCAARAKQTKDNLVKHGFWAKMTNAEKYFIETSLFDIDAQAKVDASWSMEAVACLLWALELTPSIPPYDAQADLELLKLVPDPEGQMVHRVALRSSTEIQSARDLAELWHWRSRTRRLMESGRDVKAPAELTLEGIVRSAARSAAESGDIAMAIDDDFPAFGRAYRDITDEEFAIATSIAMERHKALNWLCGLAPKNAWDETPTDT